uniref:Uncharacterized protein n=1 Tax=Molossus molossus TaxID=27622 RepID=A0A7J8DPX7_MOLMO|nr:hypothetical protein HJG59_009298 [Molossus molossus]
MSVHPHLCCGKAGAGKLEIPFLDLENFRHSHLFLIPYCFLRKNLDFSLIGFPGALGSTASVADTLTWWLPREGSPSFMVSPLFQVSMIYGPCLSFSITDTPAHRQKCKTLWLKGLRGPAGGPGSA